MPHSVVHGPDGSPLSRADLPPAGYRGRWVRRRKLLVVYAVRGGLMSLSEMFADYGITFDEFLAWCAGHISVTKRADDHLPGHQLY